MKQGDLVLLDKRAGIVIKEPVHKKWAGQVAEILIEGKVRKLKISCFVWKKEKNAWYYDHETR